MLASKSGEGHGSEKFALSFTSSSLGEVGKELTGRQVGEALAKVGLGCVAFQDDPARVTSLRAPYERISVRSCQLPKATDQPVGSVDQVLRKRDFIDREGQKRTKGTS